MGASGPKLSQPSHPAPNTYKTEATIGIHQQALHQHQERANQQQRLTVKVAVGSATGSDGRPRQQFMAFIDRRVHRVPKDFLTYLSQSMKIQDDTLLVMHGRELFTLDEVENQETLYIMNREELNALNSSGGVNNGVRNGVAKNEYGQPRPAAQEMINRNNVNGIIKNEPGQDIDSSVQRPRLKALADQIKSLITPTDQNYQAENSDSMMKSENREGGENAPYEDKRSILEQYMRKIEPTHEENEQVYSRLMQLQGFQAYDHWVPMPFPHRELTYARGMYMRGESLTVQSPNFSDFANNIANVTSRNELIFRLKRMCLQRGFRAKLSMSTTNETKSLTVIFLCNRSGKSSLRCKNPSVKGLCPFMLHYERKSQIGSNRGYYRQSTMGGVSSVNSTADVSGERKKYRAIGQAYDRLFKAPPPMAAVKSERLAKEMAGIFEEGAENPEEDLNTELMFAPEENKTQQNEELVKSMELFEFNCDLPSEKRAVDEEKEKSKYSDLIEDIDLEDNPFYLKYYRSFHNHDLDTHLMENEELVTEETLHRKGAPSYLPQGTLAIQYYVAERRKEIVEEGTANQFRFPFDHKSQTLTRFKALDPASEPILIEPQGINPFLIYCDATLDEDSMPTPQEAAQGGQQQLPPWDPSMEFLEQQRVHTIRTMIKLLAQVRSKLQTGVYSLDKWRRVLMNMSPKKPAAKPKPKKQVEKEKVPGMTSGNTKLSNIVNKILASKTGEDMIMGSDPEEEEGNEDNYDVYA